MMSATLGFYAWETIMRRSLMMMSGNCSPAEYQRMVTEKMEAATASAAAIATGNLAGALTPWHEAVRANARRLRQR